MEKQPRRPDGAADSNLFKFFSPWLSCREEPGDLAWRRSALPWDLDGLNEVEG